MADYFWKLMPDTNETARSNYPTQKSVAVLDIDVGDDPLNPDYPKGTVIAGFMDSQSGLPVRRFYTLTPGANNPQLLTTWEFEQTSSSKSQTFSFVVKNGIIYAITSVDWLISTEPKIVHGQYKIADDEWNDYDLYEGSTQPFYPDIDITPDGLKLCMAWTQYTELGRGKAFTCGWDLPPETYLGGSATAVYETVIAIPQAVTNPKISVLHENGTFFWVHCSGYHSGSGESSLYVGAYNSNIIGSGVETSISANDAAICLDENEDVGFLYSDLLELYFKYYDVSTGVVGDAEYVGNLYSEYAAFGYGLTFREGLFRSLYSGLVAGVVQEKIRVGVDDWMSGAVIQFESGYPQSDQLSYFSVQNKQNPPDLEQDIYSSVFTQIDGVSEYGLYLRSAIMLPLLPPTGDHWEYVMNDARNLNVSLVTNGLSQRDQGLESPGKNILQVMDYVVLSDDKVVMAHKDTFKIIDYDDPTYMVMELQTGNFPDAIDWGLLTKMRCVFESDEDILIHIFDEKGNQLTSVPLTWDELESEAVKYANVQGNRMYLILCTQAGGEGKVELHEIETEKEGLSEYL